MGATSCSSCRTAGCQQQLSRGQTLPGYFFFLMQFGKHEGQIPGVNVKEHQRGWICLAVLDIWLRGKHRGKHRGKLCSETLKNYWRRAAVGKEVPGGVQGGTTEL